MCKCTYGNTVTRTNILKTHSCDHMKYDHNPATISLKAFCNRQPIVEYHQGIPTWVPRDGLPQWYSTTGHLKSLHGITQLVECQAFGHKVLGLNPASGNIPEVTLPIQAL